MSALRARSESSDKFMFSCENCSSTVAVSTMYDMANPSGHYVLDLSKEDHQVAVCSVSIGKLLALLQALAKYFFPSNHLCLHDCMRIRWRDEG